MIDVCCRIEKNGWRSSEPIDTIESIKVERLTSKYTGLCKIGAQLHVYEEGTHYKEYDEYYFQAEDIVKAQDIALRHYSNNDLKEIKCEYAISLFRYDEISIDEVFDLDEDKAFKIWKEYIKK